MNNLNELLFESLALTNATEMELLRNGGELTPELEIKLQELSNLNNLKIPHKIDNYKFTIDRFETLAAEWEARTIVLEKISSHMIKLCEGLKQRLKQAMIDHKLEELYGLEHTFKLTKSNPSLVFTREKLPPEYLITKTVTEVDKENLKRDLKAGKKVEGAELVDSFAVRSYIKK